MTDFSHLQKMDVPRDRTSKFVLWMLAGKPSLDVRCAAEPNKDYFNELLRRTGKNYRQVRAGAIDQELLDENRAHNRALFPKFVIVGWSGVKDAKGADVPFSAENAVGFVKALPDWVFDEVVTYCGNVMNFVDAGADAGAVAGN